jgi:hypothetical protein
MSLPTLAEVYARWHNPNCGFELHPDQNTGAPATSENGILYHAIFNMVLEMTGRISHYDRDLFLTTACSLETNQEGVFDRGAGDSIFIDYKIRNENSQDNYLAICCGLYNNVMSMQSWFMLRQIANHGLKHYFIYNNVKPRISLPMNPGNWSVFLAVAEDHKFITKLFMPFFIINFFITMFLVSGWEKFRGKAQSTSNKQLYLLILYTLRNNKNFKWLYNIYVRRMRKLFGENFVEEMFKIYYNNPDHPIRLYAAGIKLQEQK